MLDGDNEAVIRWAAAQGMGIMSYGTLGGGILTGTYREVRTFGETDNRNRFYPYFREPLFSKVMELLEVMDAIAGKRRSVGSDCCELDIAAAFYHVVYCGGSEPEEGGGKLCRT